MQSSASLDGVKEYIPKVRLSEAFAWTLFGNLANGLSHTTILCLIAKISSAHDVGQYSLAAAVIAPVLALCSLQLRSVQASDAQRRFSFGTYLSLRLVTSGIAMVAIIACSWWAPEVATFGVIFPLAIARVGISLCDIVHGAMHQEERMDCVAKSQSISGVVQAATVIVVLLFTQSLAVACIAMAVAVFSVLLVYDLPTLQTIRPGVKIVARQELWHDSPKMLKLAWYTSPLGFVVFGFALTSSVPRFVIGHSIDTASVGVLAALMVPGVIMQQIVTALSQAALPRFANYYETNDFRRFRSLLRRVLATNACIGGLGLGLAVVAGEEILRLLFTPEFSQHQAVFLGIMLASAINCAGAIGGVLTATKRFRIQLLITLLSLLSMTITCSLWIPSDGLIGAGRALVVTAAVRLALVLATVHLAIRQATSTLSRPSLVRRAA